jgi:class 3 adenylate cyclase
MSIYQSPTHAKENLEQARFRPYSGAGLEAGAGRVCPQCGTHLPADARFCFACGVSLDTSPSVVGIEHGPMALQAVERLMPRQYVERLWAAQGRIEGERRIVTLLFADVKGSTAMARLDPEQVLEIMNGAFEVLIEPIYRYGGTLARLMGDAILAFFGAPVAHEDDAERACHAALDIISGAQRYAARLQCERSIEGFDVRVGINTGLVVVGEVGTDWWVEYTAMGDAVNLAARIERAAEPGTILITWDTCKLIHHLFETQALGPLQVKGKAEPAQTFRLLGPCSTRHSRELYSPLVGRSAEMAQLHDALCKRAMAAHSPSWESPGWAKAGSFAKHIVRSHLA